MYFVRACWLLSRLCNRRSRGNPAICVRVSKYQCLEIHSLLYSLFLWVYSFFLISLPFQWDLSRGKKSLSWMYSITFVTVNVSFWGIGSSHTSCVSWILCSYQQVNQLSEIKCIPLSFPPLFLQSSHWIEPTWGFSLVSLTSWTQRTVFICENLLTPSSFFLL